MHIKQKNRNQILEKIKHYKKLNYDEFEQESFERKPYFHTMNLENVRTRVRISSRMLATVRSDFPNKYKKKSLVCPSCRVTSDVSSSEDEIPGPLDTLEHIRYQCSAFSELRS